MIYKLTVENCKAFVIVNPSKQLTKNGHTSLNNTFASQHLVFHGKNEKFILQNALILTHDFFYFVKFSC